LAVSASGEELVISTSCNPQFANKRNVPGAERKGAAFCLDERA